MAPARMITFIKNHVAQCDVCQEDPDIHDEIGKITEMILPKSKIPKAVRLKQEQEEEASQLTSIDDMDEDSDIEEDDLSDSDSSI